MNQTEDTDSAKFIAEWVQKAKEQYESQGVDIKMFSEIFAKLEEFNYDKEFLLIIFNSLQIVERKMKQKATSPNVKHIFNSEEDCLNYYISNFFLNNLQKCSLSSSSFDTKYDQPVKSIPLEAFLKPDKNSVQKFEENLKMYEVIFGEVVNTDFKEGDNEYYVLRIISKIDDNIVYHLNINVLLFKSIEMARLSGREFQVSEILQVVIMGSIKVNNFRKHYGTTNLKLLHQKDESIDLESLSQKKPKFDLNLYKNASKFTSYAYYLESETHFNEKHHLVKGIESIGLHPTCIYSFNEEGFELISPRGFRVGDISRKIQTSKEMESNKYLEEAKRFIENQDILNALSFFDDALSIWPKNYKVFEYRGQMYADYKNNKQFCDLKKAGLDFVAALKLNADSEISKKGLSNILLCMSKKLIFKKKNYEEGKKLLCSALGLYKDNEKASNLLNKVNEKISSVSSQSKDTELIALQKERQKLLLELTNKN